jgi:hypothetical protein
MKTNEKTTLKKTNEIKKKVHVVKREWNEINKN